MRTVADDIAAHADRHPHRTALTTPAGDMTYAELATRVDEMARTLHARGARPETVCAVAVEHGGEAVAAIAASCAAERPSSRSTSRSRATGWPRSPAAPVPRCC